LGRGTHGTGESFAAAAEKPVSANRPGSSELTRMFHGENCVVSCQRAAPVISATLRLLASARLYMKQPVDWFLQ
jgi:hypothetical protein